MENGLSDYGGEFNPKVKFEDFSKEFLANYCRVMWQLLMSGSSVWERLVEENAGEEIGRECHVKYWAQLAPMQIPMMRGALNINGDDVASFIKMMQLGVGFVLEMFDISWELKNPNHAIMTVNHCAGLDYFESGQPHLVKYICQEVEAAAFDEYVRSFNPNIKITALKIPPRKSPDEIACKWEFRLDK